MMKFEVGQNVDIRARHFSNVLNVGVEIHRFVGRIVPTPKWLDTDYISVHTENPEYPISHINVKNIVDYCIDTARIDTRIFKVKSKSKNTVYNVLSKNGNVICDCVGFQYRKICKHSIAIKKFIQNA